MYKTQRPTSSISQKILEATAHEALQHSNVIQGFSLKMSTVVIFSLTIAVIHVYIVLKITHWLPMKTNITLP